MFDFILGNTVFTKAIIACCFIGILSWSVLTISYRSNVEDRADKEKVACFSEKEVRRLSRNGYQSE